MNREAAASENGNSENEKRLVSITLHATFSGDGFLLELELQLFVYGMSIVILLNSLYP